MIRELVEFGKKVRIESNIFDDSLTYEHIDAFIEISQEGIFENIYSTDKLLLVEDLVRTENAGRTNNILPRLLADNAQYVLGIPKGDRALECNKKFIEKIKEYSSSLEDILPVIKFYNNEREVRIAVEKFMSMSNEKQLNPNGIITFKIKDDDCLIIEKESVLKTIARVYNENENKRKGNINPICSICSKNEFRTLNVSVHGNIKKVPDGKPTGCAFISFNTNAFESYNLKGNDNALICTNCAKNYVEGLNYLMTNGNEKEIENKKGKVEKRFIYTNRKNLGSDTAVVFWTREAENLNELDWFDKPDPGEVANLIESVANAKANRSTNFEANKFYSITLSGVASRIAVRDWIEISIEEYRQNIAHWFKDLAIKYYDRESKELKYFYPSLNQLSWACKRENSKEDETVARVAKYLWNCALKKQKPPLWILTKVLKRIVHNQTSEEGKSINTFTNSRASLIKLIINRNNNGGSPMLKEELDLENKTPAYLCGRLFALIEGIQLSALGKNVNAGVRERFFAAASSNPAPAFGRLMRLTQHHLTKLKQEKAGLAVILDKEVTELCSLIDQFPAILNLEQQGQFALGYYHQKQFNFTRAKQNKDFELLTENMEETENE